MTLQDVHSSGRSAELAATGIQGLDTIVRGGLPRDRLYLVDGEPGTGKTTLAIQFLIEGRAQGETCLYVTLSETKVELYSVAASHGLSLDGIEIHELNAGEEAALPENQYTVFHPSEVELAETTMAIMATVERVRPHRVVFDSLSEMRLLARDPLRYRRQIFMLKQLFIGRGATVLLLDDRTSGEGDLQLHSLTNGVIRLEQDAPDYGAARRRLRVVKLRGVPFESGYHDIAIERGGLVVYPRSVARSGRLAVRESITSGVPQLDVLFGGGLDRGTTVLLLGPAGVGKSALGTQYAVAAADRGEKAAIYLFDESVETYCWRARGLGCDVDPHVEQRNVIIADIDPSALSPGEFMHRVRTSVDAGARVVVFDSLTGYLASMPKERQLLLQLHELFAYLRHRGVLSIAILAQAGLVGQMHSSIDLSYLADTVVLMRYFEAAGEVRKAISVMKKRSGGHERTIREFRLGPDGIRVGEPLVQFRGILTGVPSYVGNTEPLLGDRR